MLDMVWVLISAALVFLMQAGFMCLESGLTRAKNSINVAMKNLADLNISIFLFWACGFALMFGESAGGWIGLTNWFQPITQEEGWFTAFFLFQAMFCATAATIVSGAVAERMRFTSYILVTVLISSLTYPIFGHWAWNGAHAASATGWLENLVHHGRNNSLNNPELSRKSDTEFEAKTRCLQIGKNLRRAALGFVDFAGSTVVHSLGGWLVLAALLVIGPRTGRFSKDAKPKKITGSNLPMSVLGVILLWLGWFGFNGGSLFALNAQVAGIIANTVLAGTSGAIIALAVGWPMRKIPDVSLLINGSLAGLVAITASCHAVTTTSAVIIGGIGGLVMLGVEHLLERFRIDDAVGAIPVHLGAGIWGTLAVALFGKTELLGSGLSIQSQLGVQMLGIATCAVWAFGVGYLILRVINQFLPLRVTPEAEHNGLNVSEHGATTEVFDLLMAMETQAETGDLSRRVLVEPFTEVGQIAEGYNRAMDALQAEITRSEVIVRDLRDGIITFTEEGVLSSINPCAELMFGYSKSELLGHPITVLLTGCTEAQETTSADFMDEFATADVNTTALVEMVGKRKDGSTFPVELTIIN